MSSFAETRRPATKPAVAAPASFGLYPAADFTIVDGECSDCATLPQALWYFRHETIAVPNPGEPIASFARGMRVEDDLRAWLAARVPDAAPEYPPLVWIAAPEVIEGARLGPELATIAGPSGRAAFALTSKIALNRSYFDARSATFFGGRKIKARGTTRDGTFVARTLWPEDFRLERALPLRALDAEVPAALALRNLIRSEPNGGARSAFAAYTLWQRDPSAPRWTPGRAVVALMLNGAQGDDDEAHGGHFALVTGRLREDGDLSEWLVNNFYALDSESEKGIIATPVPLDNYLADLNSGQNWYRPSQMIVAVLATERAPALVQAALNRVYNQFYRHQLHYRHATMNCAGISVDVLRLLGWPLPPRPPASRLAAAFGFPWFALGKRSIEKACVAFDYLNEDQTRLMPAAAFEEGGAGLLELASASPDSKPAHGLARTLSDDLESILFVRFPQLPSSRAWGDAPVVTPWEFNARMPPEPQIVPVPPRPFPERLRDADLLPEPTPPSHYAAAIWGVLSVVGIPWVLRAAWKRRRDHAV